MDAFLGPHTALCGNFVVHYIVICSPNIEVVSHRRNVLRKLIFISQQVRRQVVVCAHERRGDGVPLYIYASVLMLVRCSHVSSLCIKLTYYFGLPVCLRSVKRRWKCSNINYRHSIASKMVVIKYLHVAGKCRLKCCHKFYGNACGCVFILCQTVK